jgi:hypothetical protein
MQDTGDTGTWRSSSKLANDAAKDTRAQIVRFTYDCKRNGGRKGLGSPTRRRG